MSEPKILVWDIETGGINAFKADLGMMLCFGYKWLGEKETHILRVSDYRGWWKRGRGVDDSKIIQAALELIGKADWTVAHYGVRFDRRFLHGRCVIHDFAPPPPVSMRDTWSIARTAFAFSSNRLVNLAKVLKLDEQKHQKSADEWPGWWFRAMAGSKEDVERMGEYCMQDVRATEKVYQRIRPYDWTAPRMHTDRSTCGACGSDRIIYHGTTPIGGFHYRRFQCFSCGTWGRDKKHV